MWAKIMTGPFTFDTVELPSPSAADLDEGEVLLRVLAAGLCGSDGPFYRGAVNVWNESLAPAPGFPVHEVAGEVIASRSRHHSPGDRVVGWATRYDGLQELIVSDGESLWAYGSALQPTQAVMLQPLACVLYAADRLGDVSGQHCAIIGQGPIGVLFSRVLKTRGARTVTGVDRLDRRADMAPFLVDDPVVLSSGAWVRTLTDDASGPDVVVEAVGHQVSTLGHAIDAVRPQGRVLYFGIPDDDVYPIDMEKMVRKHLTLIAGSTLERRRVLAAADAYVAEHPELVPAFVTHEYGIDDVADAYAAAFTPAGGRLKVVIRTAD
jgi:threonine dehydrogenase-like Zn-dependent dehydrogenase